MSRLRVLLSVSDVAALTIGWALAVPVSAGAVTTERLGAVGASIVATLAAFSWSGMYRRSVVAVRTVEIGRTVRGVWLASLSVGLGCAVWDIDYGVRQALVGAAVNTGVVVLSRGVFRYWLMRQRSLGRYCQKIILAGAHEEGDEWLERFDEHPELGFRVVGVAGSAGCDGRSATERAAADVDAVELAAQTGASGVLIIAPAFEPDALGRLVRASGEERLYVQITSASGNVLLSRVRLQSFIHQTAMFIAPVRPRGIGQRAKRLLDLGLSLVALVLAAPLLVLVAASIKLGDRGPVLFRQERVGWGGRSFVMLKFRTMHVGAEDRLEQVRRSQGNQRLGPLFKLETDPRFTRLGRWLDRTSINELPQLWNVVRGEMSLVGPRPSLPREHSHFDEELRRRVAVRPGISGLWQVEAREAGSFQSYRRLDLQYVDNWSLTLDFVILIATVETVVGRVLLPIRPLDPVDGGSSPDFRQAS